MRLFAKLLGPPLVWLTTLQLVYGVAKFACDVGISRLSLHATTAAALAAIAATVALSWRNLRLIEVTAPAGSEMSAYRARVVSVGSLVLAAQLLVIVLGQELAILLVGPCE